jgi:hypothetical protein
LDWGFWILDSLAKALVTWSIWIAAVVLIGLAIVLLAERSGGCAPDADHPARFFGRHE